MEHVEEGGGVDREVVVMAGALCSFSTLVGKRKASG